MGVEGTPTPPRARPDHSSSNQSSAPWHLAVPPELVEHLAGLVAERVAELVPNRPEPYLDVEAAAEYLAAPRSRMYELVERRAVAVSRDGRRLLFRPADLDAYLAREDAA